MPSNFSRRDMLGATMAGAVAAGALGNSAAVYAKGNGGNFPADFLWGAASSGHQFEGGNTNSDVWFLEHMQPTVFAESSGDACDHYNRFESDIALLASLGLNTFRFSLEWARIEPAKGEFSSVQRDHYRRVAATCRSHGITPVITFNHVTCPRWFAEEGGWEDSRSPALFERYCSYAAKGIADLAGAAATFNEPNIGQLLDWIILPPQVLATINQSRSAAARQSATGRFSSLMMGDQALMQPNMLAAHRRGFAAIKAANSALPVGLTLAISDDQAVGPASRRDEKRQAIYEPWLETARHDDFIGVQTYGRALVDAKGPMEPPRGAELTQGGLEYYPEALGATIRYAFEKTGKPVYVTENGIATEDDSRRIAYITTALHGVKSCLDDGIPVKSYIHWSLLDNFEWISGFRPKFGLVAVERSTFKRMPKASAILLGSIARANQIHAA